MSIDDITPNVDAMRFEFPQKECFQVRIHREYDEIKDMLEDYVAQSAIAFGFQHEADEEVSRTHCHTYYFGLKKAKNTVDKYFRSRFTGGNADFSVSQTCGKKKRPLDVVGAWNYGTTEKLLEPTYTHGLSEEEIKYLRLQAIEFWNKIKAARAKPKGQNTVEIIEVVIEKEKRDNVWLRYFEKMMLNKAEMKTWSRDKIRRWIIADYLNQCKAPPRVADVNRYSFGLYILSRKENNDDLNLDDVHLGQQY